MGIIQLNFREIKAQICRKVKSLMDSLHKMIVKQFVSQTKYLDRAFAEIEQKITQTYYSIDDIIVQIEYIKMHYHNRDLVEDLIAKLIELRNKKVFMDEHKIYLPSEGFMRYMGLYTYPVKVKKKIQEKYKGLNNQRKQLKQLLQTDVDEVKHNIECCQAIIDEFKSKGLLSTAEVQRMADQKVLSADLTFSLE